MICPQCEDVVKTGIRGFGEAGSVENADLQATSLPLHIPRRSWASMEDRELVLITGRDCDLCDRAHGVLAELGLSVRELDVASEEAEGLARSGVPLAFLPVLCDGERVLAYGRLSERALRRRLAA
jgi:glutaredoxin